jgi:hypothetical protein
VQANAAGKHGAGNGVHTEIFSVYPALTDAGENAYANPLPGGNIDDSGGRMCHQAGAACDACGQRENHFHDERRKSRRIFLDKHIKQVMPRISRSWERDRQP